MNKYFVSICIPSYNRPRELLRLLKSVGCNPRWNIQIVICEDMSPKRNEIRLAVETYKLKSPYDVKYIENQFNMGYDGNIRNLIIQAEGEYIIYMGDDDLFICGVLDDYLAFLQENDHLGYVLRSYRNNYNNGDTEYYRYYNETKFFEAGESTYSELFRKSVFISGFTFKRELALGTLTGRFDGTLLYQLYLQAEICLKHPSAYYNVPLTEAYEGGDFYFGNSEKEKALYTPNKHTVQGEVNFIASFFKITRFMDEKYSIYSTEVVIQDMSKYSFPMLALISENGRKDLKEYYRELKKLGFGVSKYFTLYYVGLYLFGPAFCRKLIRFIKRVMGKTPKL